MTIRLANMKFMHLGRARTLLLVMSCVLGLSCVMGLFLFILLPLFGLFASVAVPASCTDHISHLPASRDYAVPGIGTGALLVENAHVAVVVIADYGQSPFYTHVYIVNRHTNQVANYRTGASKPLHSCGG